MGSVNWRKRGNRYQVAWRLEMVFPQVAIGRMRAVG